MQRMINGKLVEVQTNPDGSVSSDSIRRAIRMPKERPFVLHTPDGSNKVVNPGENIPFTTDKIFVDDIPLHIRGIQAAITMQG